MARRHSRYSVFFPRLGSRQSGHYTALSSDFNFFALLDGLEQLAELLSGFADAEFHGFSRSWLIMSEGVWDGIPTYCFWVREERKLGTLRVLNQVDAQVRDFPEFTVTGHEFDIRGGPERAGGLDRVGCAQAKLGTQAGCGFNHVPIDFDYRKAGVTEETIEEFYSCLIGMANGLYAAFQKTECGYCQLARPDFGP